MAKALVCKEWGPIEKVELRDDWEPQALGEHDVRIAVKAAGLNFPDVLIIEGKYQFKPELPFVPGGEASGVVTEVGAKVTRCAVGDDVITMGAAGCFSSEVVAMEFAVFKKPKALSHAQASGISITYFTSYHALKQRADLQAGETLLVLGAAGGVGLTAVEIGKAMGARVIAAASSDEKLEICKQFGADEVINYSDGNLKEAIRAVAPDGVDVVYDPVGGDFSEQALRCMAWKGRFLVIGFASGPIPKVPLNLALLKGCQIVGVFWGAFSGKEPERNLKNIEELWEMFEAGTLNPLVGKEYPVEDYRQAWNDMIGRKAVGKLVVRFDD